MDDRNDDSEQCVCMSHTNHIYKWLTPLKNRSMKENLNRVTAINETNEIHLHYRALNCYCIVGCSGVTVNRKVST